jgi:hypothetical protein
MNYNNESVNKIDIFFENYKFIEKIKGQYPDANWEDSFSVGQLKSKLWLLDELSKIKKSLGMIFMYGGWYGILAKLMFECDDIPFEKIRSFDLDDSCHEIAESINRPVVMDGWQFKATTLDVLKITIPLAYTTLRRDGSEVELTESPDTIINTSCEHMTDKWFNEIPVKTIVVLQSNNFTEVDDHINCVGSINEMKMKYPMEHIYFEGELILDDYTRYMIIGIK